MTSSDRLLRLFDYDHWANLKIATILKEYPSFNNRKEAVRLFAHITAAPAHWLARINGVTSPGVEIWPEPELNECISRAGENHRRIRTLVEESSDDLDRTVSYTNSSGKAFESLLSDILHHLVIHGQHHRAQIALLLRMDDIVPPQTDFIAFVRET